MQSRGFIFLLMANIHLSQDNQSCSVGDQTLHVGERYLVSYYVEVEAFQDNDGEMLVITDAGLFNIEDFLHNKDEE